MLSPGTPSRAVAQVLQKISLHQQLRHSHGIEFDGCRSRPSATGWATATSTPPCCTRKTDRANDEIRAWQCKRRTRPAPHPQRHHPTQSNAPGQSANRSYSVFRPYYRGTDPTTAARRSGPREHVSRTTDSATSAPPQAAA
jgi:hypothetical protein